jgi:hypothetical protein
MKQGQSLAVMAQAIKYNHETKRDFLVGTESVFLGSDKRLYLETANSLISFDVSDRTHQQIGARYHIPSNYYQKMLTEAPALLAENLNHWFAVHREKRMVRTLADDARAFLSDRYMVVDNIDIVEAVFPVLEELGLGKSVVSCHVGPDRMYLKVIHPRLQAEVKPGDIVQSGFVLSNSESGNGATTVQPLIYRLVCTNGLIAPDKSLKTRQIHLGRRLNGGGDSFARQFFSQQTLMEERKLYLRQTIDLVRGLCQPEIFDRVVEQMRSATADRIEGQPHKAVEMLARRIKLSETETDGVLNHLLLAGDLSRYGMLNAVTRYSQDAEQYDRATELEQLGGLVLNMPRADWREVASAGI